MYNSKGGASPPLEICIYYNIQKILWKSEPNKPSTKTEPSLGVLA